MVCVCITLAVGGCTSSAVSKGAPPLVPQGAPVRLVVLGADEAVGAGVGRAERNRSTWPQLLFREHLPVRATLVDLASPGATTVDVRDAQVPRALGLQPTIAIVWVDEQGAVLTAALRSLTSAGSHSARRRHTGRGRGNATGGERNRRAARKCSQQCVATSDR